MLLGDLEQDLGVWQLSCLPLKPMVFFLTVILVIKPSSRVTFLDDKFDAILRVGRWIESAAAFLLPDALPTDLLLDREAAVIEPR